MRIYEDLTWLKHQGFGARTPMIFCQFTSHFGVVPKFWHPSERKQGNDKTNMVETKHTKHEMGYGRIQPVNNMILSFPKILNAEHHRWLQVAFEVPVFRQTHIVLPEGRLIFLTLGIQSQDKGTESAHTCIERIKSIRTMRYELTKQQELVAGMILHLANDLLLMKLLNCGSQLGGLGQFQATWLSSWRQKIKFQSAKEYLVKILDPWPSISSRLPRNLEVLAQLTMLNHQVYLCIPSPSAGSMDGSFGLLLGHRGEIGDGLARLGRLWPGLLDHESVGGSAGEATAPRSLPGRCPGKRAVESGVEGWLKHREMERSLWPMFGRFWWPLSGWMGFLTLAAAPDEYVLLIFFWAEGRRKTLPPIDPCKVLNPPSCEVVTAHQPLGYNLPETLWLCQLYHVDKYVFYKY